MTVTQKSSKQFRFTFVSRLQNFVLSTIENLFRANDVFVSKADINSQKKRLSYQRSAMTDLKVLRYKQIKYREKLITVLLGIRLFGFVFANIGQFNSLDVVCKLLPYQVSAFIPAAFCFIIAWK